MLVTSMWATALVLMITSILSYVVFSFMITDLHFLKTVLRTFSGALLGQILLLPAIFCWAILDKPSMKKISSSKIIELGLMLTALAISITITLASLDSQTPVHYIFPYMTLPLLVWSTFRFGIRLTLILSIVTSLFTKYLASLGHIPFGSTELSAFKQVIEMNIGLIAINVTVLILAIIVAVQEETKNALTKRDEWFNIAINHMSGGLYLLDKERRVKILSTNLQKKFSLPVEICHTGAHIKQILKFRAARGDYGPGDPDEAVLLRMIELEKTETTRGQNTLPDGRTYEYFQNHTKDDEIIVIYYEISERIKAEKDSQTALIEAQQANNAKTGFLANMSHELRTPLNAIIGFSEIMSKGDFAQSSPKKVKEYSKDIHMSGHHLLQIINDILDLSKIEAGMADTEPDIIRLSECVKECVTFLDIRARGAELVIFNEIKEDNITIYADRRMFKQIMINLLSNSVKFTPPGGSIHISQVTDGSGNTTISVADTGIGIDENEIENMMEPFRQADSSLSREFEGTGLGLPLVKSLIDLHGGNLKIKSTVGVGTTVFISFPGPK